MGKEPNFDLKSVKSFRLNQIWSDYLERMNRTGYSGYRDAMKEYILRYPERTGRREDTIVSGDVWWIRDWNPKWGTTESYGYEKKKILSFVNPRAQPQPDADRAPPAPSSPEEEPATPPPSPWAPSE
jgi:hypothetical protein